ncbi:MAG: TonB-dependent receptor plug domain-containing protein [Bacteroidales bacterium]|nr:TonB-dependent receptor plug domain-containing protein [Bacteroidales bacterium]
MKEQFFRFELLLLMVVFISAFSIGSTSAEYANFPLKAGINETTHISPVQYVIFSGMLIDRDIDAMQDPEEMLTKEEKRQLRKEQKQLKRAERAERRALERAERAAESVVDNPNNADYILLGKNLPRGRGVLQALSGRVPGLMISEDGYVMAHGPSSFYGGGTPLFLVDEIEVSRDYANSMSIEDIERIEIFTGPSAAIYGSRVGTAVISIYTVHSVNKATSED